MVCARKPSPLDPPFDGSGLGLRLVRELAYDCRAARLPGVRRVKRNAARRDYFDEGVGSLTRSNEYRRPSDAVEDDVETM